jgi:hypothetical protein
VKIRHPFALKLASVIGTNIIRSLCGTMRYRTRFIGENYLPNNPHRPERVIYIFWHEHMLIPAYFYGRKDLFVLASPHADGQWMAGMLERLGFSIVRGSSNNGGSEAMRQMMRLAGQVDFAISPDGPRGPRRQVKDGPIYLAARTGMPIVPVGFSCVRQWRAKSWDRLMVPKLFTRGYGVAGEPIRVPRGLGKDALEEHRTRVENALHHVVDLAERWALTGSYDDSTPAVASSR